MKNIILSAALALSSIVAPAAAHADGRDGFGRGHAQPVYAPQYSQPVFAQRRAQPPVVVPQYAPQRRPPQFAPPVFVQPNGYGHGDERGDRDGRGREERRDDGRSGRDRGRDEGRGQWSRGHDGWRR